MRLSKAPVRRSTGAHRCFLSFLLFLFQNVPNPQGERGQRSEEKKSVCLLSPFAGPSTLFFFARDPGRPLVVIPLLSYGTVSRVSFSFSLTHMAVPLAKCGTDAVSGSARLARRGYFPVIVEPELSLEEAALLGKITALADVIKAEKVVWSRVRADKTNERLAEAGAILAALSHCLRADTQSRRLGGINRLLGQATLSSIARAIRAPAGETRAATAEKRLSVKEALVDVLSDLKAIGLSEATDEATRDALVAVIARQHDEIGR